MIRLKVHMLTCGGLEGLISEIDSQSNAAGLAIW